MIITLLYHIAKDENSCKSAFVFVTCISIATTYNASSAESKLLNLKVSSLAFGHVSKSHDMLSHFTSSKFISKLCSWFRDEAIMSIRPRSRTGRDRDKYFSKGWGSEERVSWQNHDPEKNFGHTWPCPSWWNRQNLKFDSESEPDWKLRKTCSEGNV